MGWGVGGGGGVGWLEAGLIVEVAVGKVQGEKSGVGVASGDRLK